MKFFYFLISIVLISFTGDNSLVEEKIVFKGRKRSIHKIYTLQVPDYNRTVMQLQGGHGHGFHVIYSDNATIYYSNDWASGSPNHKNFESIKWQRLVRFTSRDSIVYGKQSDGRFWKEIKNGGDYIGYLNVSDQYLNQFEKSILTLEKK